MLVTKKPLEQPPARGKLKRREERAEGKEEALGTQEHEVPLGLLFWTPALTLHRPAWGLLGIRLKSPEVCPSAQGTSVTKEKLYLDMHMEQRETVWLLLAPNTS